MSGPQITIARKSGAALLTKRVLGLTKLSAYVGVPASSSKDRSNQLLGMAAKSKGKKATRLQKKAAENDINNAELLFIFSKGSPKRHQPARPVLQPAVAADGNRQKIGNQIAASCKASLAGDKPLSRQRMGKAALAGQNAARDWFTDPRNSWKDLADSTKRDKVRRLSPAQRKTALDKNGELLPGSYTIGVETGAMRAAIQGIIGEE